MQFRGAFAPARWGRQIVPFTLGIATLGASGIAAAQGGPGYVNAPKPWELDLQPSATTGMDQLTALHDGLLVIITVICLFVLGLLGYVVWRFRESRNPVPTRTTHNTFLEVAWTIIPILILVGIAIPSFKLLYDTDKIQTAELTVKVIGHQWYWTYEYPDYRNARGEAVSLDSRMIPEKEIDKSKGQIRLLSTDNQLIVPIKTKVRVIMTSEDVMHGWAVPAFGMKRTVVPGRLNETWFEAHTQGLFYGQCSQICGKDHTYMPIAVRVVPKDEFAKWIEQRRTAASLDEPSRSVAAASPAGR